MGKIKVAVVILNWNGKKFLETFLPVIVKHSPKGSVIVADNASSDDSVDFLQQHFPEVRIILNSHNSGYAGGYNEALKQLNAEYLVLLNSDIEVTANWIYPIIQLMDSDLSIAACQPKLRDYYKKEFFEYAGASGGFIDNYVYPFCRGRIFNVLEKDTGQYNDIKEVFWASGACMFVRSSAFYEAGQLDEDYFAHMEEIDLCWRMKNLGYKIMVVPESVVYHVGGGTLNKLSPKKTYLNFRNNLITLLKNHKRRFLFIKLIFRMMLDGIAAFKFLIEGQAGHFVAVIKAHFAFYASFSKTWKKRQKLRSLEKFRDANSSIYKGNIVKEHFIFKKKCYSELS